MECLPQTQVRVLPDSLMLYVVAAIIVFLAIKLAHGEVAESAKSGVDESQSTSESHEPRPQ